MAVEKLKDIPVYGPELLEELAKFAPQEDEKDATPDIRKGEKSSYSRNGGAGLGRFDVERYLQAHNIVFSIKNDRDRTLYRLDQCFFDPNHKKESAIVQSANGMLTYQCFHKSCNYTWSDARAHISGEKSLAEFHENYDPNWQPPRKKEKKTKKDSERNWLSFSEKGRAIINSKLLADDIEDHFAPLMHDEILDRFYQYDDIGIWRHITDGMIERYLVDVLDELAKKHIMQEVVHILKKKTLVTQEEVFENAFFLNIRNGMLDIKSMTLHPHAPEYHSKVQMPVRFDQSAQCPMWIKALSEIFCDDLAKIDVLQQFFGYCLYPQVIFPCALFQIGGGGNGKGVVEEIINSMLGDENVSHISMERMQKPFGPIEIKDKLLNSCGETESAPLDVTNFKTLAAGGKIQAEVKYRGDVTFRPIAKHMISMNAFPGLKEKTKSFFRRVIVLEYNQTFEGSADDVKLVDKLKKELDGIFMWALDGLAMVLEFERILVPESVDRAKERFREATNALLIFIRECCIQGEEYYAPKADFWRVYKSWYDDGGGPAKYRLTKKNFYEGMRLNVATTERRIGSRDCLVGVGLLETQWNENQCELPVER